MHLLGIDWVGINAENGRKLLLSPVFIAVVVAVRIAVRALSPGIDDPFTAGSVLYRFADGLCSIAPRHLPGGAVERDGRIVFALDVVSYDKLCDGMFHTIRQNGSGSATC